MSRGILRRRAVWVLVGVVLATALVSGGAARHYWVRRQELNRMEDRLAEAKRRIRLLEARRSRAEGDDGFIEIAARRELGLLGPDEIEFRFVED